MAKNTTEKTQAEIYREERKQRIAKANKKNAKGKRTSSGIGTKIVAIILCVAIVLGIGYYIVALTGVVNKATTAVKVGNVKVSTAEYNFYYNMVYNNVSQMAQMYSQYGMDMGFDTNTSPDEQDFKKDDGTTVTYAEYFRTSAIDMAQNVEATCAEAEKEGFTLDEDAKAEIEETMQSFKDNASQSGFSLNSYLKAVYGSGLTEKTFRKLIEKQYISQEFAEKKQADLKAAVKDEDIAKEYNDNKEKYDYIDICYYVFTAKTITKGDKDTDDTVKAKQEKENAKLYKDVQGIAEKATDVKALEKAVKEYTKSDKKEDVTTTSKHTTYEAIKNSMNEDVAKAVYDSKTAVNKAYAFEDGNKSYVVIVLKAPYTGYSVDVRHCLVKFDAADEENVTDEEKAAAKKEAEKLLADWKAGKATEETFKTMASENSDDEGSIENGGLIEDIRYSSSLVENFLDWAMDPARKDGETGIVETEYGYHIMYFVGADKDDLDWKVTIRDAKGSEAYTEYSEGVTANEAYAVESSDSLTTRVMKDFCKKIKRSLASSNYNK